MKKGIVMEKHRKYIIIMTREGAFHKAIPIDGAIIGAEVSYKPLESEKKAKLHFFPGKKLNIQLLAMACVLFLLVLPIYFLMGSNKTYAYVNIDINPSIELEIDDELKVNSIRPLNDDAKIILKQLESYEHEKLKTVIKKIMDKTEQTGLINDDKNMLVGVSYTSDNKKKVSIVANLKRFLKNNAEWEIAAFNVPAIIREKAKEKNKSMNEVMAATIIQKDNQEDRDESMNDKDKAIIQSFYNTDNDHSKKNTGKDTIKITPKESKDTIESRETEKNKAENRNSYKEENAKENKHPSELKNKNGRIDSKDKNHHRKNKTTANDNAKKHTHQKEKNKSSPKAKENKDGKNNKFGKNNNKEKNGVGKHKYKGQDKRKFHNNGHGNNGDYSKRKNHNNGHGKHKDKGKTDGSNNWKGHKH